MISLHSIRDLRAGNKALVLCDIDGLVRAFSLP